MRVRTKEIAPSLVARRGVLDLDDFSREEIELVLETSDAMKEILAREIRKSSRSARQNYYYRLL